MRKRCRFPPRPSTRRSRQTILLLEHVRIDRPLVGRVMDLIDPLLLRINGSHLNRRTVENVRHAGLRITQMEEFGPMGVVRLIEAGLDGARS